MRTANRITLLILAAGLVSLQGAAFAETPAGAAPDTKVLAVINGQNATNADFATFINSRISQNMSASNLNQQQLNALLGEYINRELVYQDAVAKGLDKNREIMTAMENQRHNIIAGYALRQVANTPISDKALQDAYKNLAAKPVKEYRVSHILLKTEADAQNVINSLKQGGDFAKLAKENSTDASAQNDALNGLKTGSYSQTPVHSQYGWHVLKLEETRIVPPPSFEESKDRLTQQLRNESIAKYVNQLHQNGKIEIKQQ
jgi:peptidyl-prolyl cis-trans isomerase C